jgi:hypothetical protein
MIQQLDNTNAINSQIQRLEAISKSGSGFSGNVWTR